jgi:hypothetical protein
MSKPLMRLLFGALLPHCPPARRDAGSAAPNVQGR